MAQRIEDTEVLKPEEMLFIDTYLSTMNVAFAFYEYRKAKTGDASLPEPKGCRQNGWRLIRTPRIKTEVQKRLAVILPETKELLMRLYEVAIFDLSKYLSDDWEVNLQALKEDGLGWMIKGVKDTRYGKEIVFRDLDSNLFQLITILERHSVEGLATINETISAEQKLKDKLEEIKSILK